MGFEFVSNGLNFRANREESRACSSYPKVQPKIDEVNFRANREESRACSSYPKVQPKIDEVNGFGKVQGLVLCTFYMAK